MGEGGQDVQTSSYKLSHQEKNVTMCSDGC